MLCWATAGNLYLQSPLFWGQGAACVYPTCGTAGTAASAVCAVRWLGGVCCGCVGFWVSHRTRVCLVPCQWLAEGWWVVGSVAFRGLCAQSGAAPLGNTSGWQAVPLPYSTGLGCMMDTCVDSLASGRVGWVVFGCGRTTAEHCMHLHTCMFGWLVDGMQQQHAACHEL